MVVVIPQLLISLFLQIEAISIDPAALTQAFFNVLFCPRTVAAVVPVLIFDNLFHVYVAFIFLSWSYFTAS